MKPDFEKIKGLTKEIVDELKVKETINEGVEKTKGFVDKTSTRVGTYVDAIKEVREQEIREKEYPLCLEDLRALDGLTIEVCVGTANPLLYSTNLDKVMKKKSRYAADIKTIVEDALKASLEESVKKLITKYGDCIFDMTVFEYTLSINLRTFAALDNIAKNIVCGKAKDVVFLLNDAELVIPNGVVPHRFVVTKENVTKRVENSTLYFDVVVDDNKYTIRANDMVSIDTFNSLLDGTYQSIDLLYFDEENMKVDDYSDYFKMPLRSFVILKTN